MAESTHDLTCFIVIPVAEVCWTNPSLGLQGFGADDLDFISPAFQAVWKDPQTAGVRRSDRVPALQARDVQCGP